MQRLAHLALGAAIGAFVYSPLRTVPEAVLVVQVLVFPLLVMSGLLMWRGARLRRWRHGR
jgi:hypothetical protein